MTVRLVRAVVMVFGHVMQVVSNEAGSCYVWVIGHLRQIDSCVAGSCCGRIVSYRLLAVVLESAIVLVTGLFYWFIAVILLACWLLW